MMENLRLCTRPCISIGLLLLLLVLVATATSTQALAGRSASKRKKNAAGSDTGKGGGFGKTTTNSKNMGAYIPDDSSATRSLLEFLKEEECEGIGAEGGTEIGFCRTTGRRGLFAADDYQGGEMMLGIPFPCCITLAMDDVSVGEPSDAELGLRLMNLLSANENSNEKESADFGPYFQSFPTREGNFDATPDFWTVPEIEQLEFPFIINKAMDRKESIADLARSENVDKSKLQFATWIVKSRGFTLLKPMMAASPPGTHDVGDATELPLTTIVSKTVLMPYIDMINHSNPESANAQLQVLETKAEDESFYALQATRLIRKGTEITIAYGTGEENTADLLASYGFVPDKNTRDAKFMSESWSDHSWSTTLEEDEAALEGLTEASGDNVMKKILNFRIRMKKNSRQ